MNYRQWKKNYKKRYGVNPPASIDKRKQRKAAARALNVLANTDFSEVINRAAESIASELANIMRTFGSACDRAGTICRNAAENKAFGNTGEYIQLGHTEIWYLSLCRI